MSASMRHVYLDCQLEARAALVGLTVVLATFAPGLAAITDRGDQRSSRPPAAGCVGAAVEGDRTLTCNGLRVDARIPSQCVRSACGLILELHGDTGTGLLEDAHVRLRELGVRDGYIVIAPTG